jgi:hypothetical protein
VTVVRHITKGRHPFDKRYVRGFTVPKKVAAGRVLVHNHMKHKETTPNGVNGFRAWTQLADGEGVTADVGVATLSRAGVRRLKTHRPPRSHR